MIADKRAPKSVRPTSKPETARIACPACGAATGKPCREVLTTPSAEVRKLGRFRSTVHDVRGAARGHSNG